MIKSDEWQVIVIAAILENLADKKISKKSAENLIDSLYEDDYKNDNDYNDRVFGNDEFFL